MPSQVIRLIHLTGVFALFLSLGAMIASEKGTRVRWASILHGISLLVIIGAGFAMLHQMGIDSNLPLWVWGKIAIWLIFGGSLVLAKRKLMPKGTLVSLLIVLGALACFLAFWQP